MSAVEMGALLVITGAETLVVLAAFPTVLSSQPLSPFLPPSEDYQQAILQRH